VVFVGGTTWFPNLDALEFFGQDILPRIRAEGTDPGVTWVGRATKAQQESYRKRFGITLPGYVTDIRTHLAEAACVIVPLRVGGGTRLKILDAWAMGKAVVSTSVGCEGLEARDGENILVRDDPAEFARAVAEVLRDQGLRSKLGHGARKTAELEYSWEVIGRRLASLYSGVVRHPASEEGMGVRVG
jgi:glycosyltransferase involved in cell wall biosynthesis